MGQVYEKVGIGWNWDDQTLGSLLSTFRVSLSQVAMASNLLAMASNTLWADHDVASLQKKMSNMNNSPHRFTATNSHTSHRILANGKGP